MKPGFSQVQETRFPKQNRVTISDVASVRDKVVEVGEETLRKVQTAAKWLLDNPPLLELRSRTMPVFRGDSQSTAISQEARDGIIDQIGSEISGSTSENGPVIFEIPLKGMDEYDVLVVWEEWETKQIPEGYWSIVQ